MGVSLDELLNELQSTSESNESNSQNLNESSLEDINVETVDVSLMQSKAYSG